MADIEANSVPVLAVTAAVGAIVLLIVLVCGVGRKDDKQEDEQDEKKENGVTKEHPKQDAAPKKQKPLRKKESKHTFSHPWLASSLKMHGSPVLGLDFSPNGKFLASVAGDRSILLWYTKEFESKEHRSIRGNVELDYATKIKFSPDTKAFIVNLSSANTIRIYRLGKKADGAIGNIQATFDFPKVHKAEIINIGIASSGKYIMTCSRDTTIIIWDLKGEVLNTINTNQVNNCFGLVSPCGRFVGSAGFTTDVKVWEVVFDKGGNYKEVVRAFELTGHKAGIYSFGFSSDSSRMATISKDGTWKLWNTFVEYAKGQDPKLITTGTFNHTGPSLISLSPDGRTVAVASKSNISLYDAATTELSQTIEDVHSEAISSLEFDLTSKFLVTSGDKAIHVFHNVTGHKSTIADLKEKQRLASNQSLKERLQQQIDQAQLSLQSIEESSS